MSISKHVRTTLSIALFIVACGFVVWNGVRGDLSESLYGATLNRNHEKMVMLIRFGADPNFKFMGTTPVLQEAIDNNDAKGVAILLRSGASIELVDSHFQRMLEAPKFRDLLKAEQYHIHQTDKL